MTLQPCKCIFFKWLVGGFPGGLVVRISGFQCRGPGSIPSQETEIPQAMQHGRKNKWLVYFKQVNCMVCELYLNKAFFKKSTVGLPWWRSDWESACQCRGHGFEPWSGRIPHAVEQLGPWATTAEPARLELVLRNKRGPDSERPAHCDEEWPLLAATRESPRTETKTQHSQK